MESIVRAALAAGGKGSGMSFGKMPSEDGAGAGANANGTSGEEQPPQPPLSPSPAVRFASPVAIPLGGDKDELAPSLPGPTGAGEDVEVGACVVMCVAVCVYGMGFVRAPLHIYTRPPEPRPSTSNPQNKTGPGPAADGTQCDGAGLPGHDGVPPG